jgi:DNA-binding MarR family transcriptional regulator
MGLMRRMAELRLMRPKLNLIEPDLSWPQMGLMMYLAERAPQHLQDIADGLGITAPSASVAVRRLEEGGWLQRQPDPDDKRASLISLSDKGRAVQQQMLAHTLEGAALFLSGLNETEQDELLDLLEKAIRAAEQQRERQSPPQSQE